MSGTATQRLTLSLAFLAIAGCASSPPAAPPERATLEVVNRTREDLGIDVRGRIEMEVRPGQRARVRELEPGAALVVARAVTGGAGAFQQKDELTLVAGQSTTWVVLPDAAAGEPLPEPPPLGSLNVANATPAHVRLALDGVTLGRVFAGQSRRFVDLPSGPHELTATPEDGAAAIHATVDVPPGDELAWQVATVGGGLHVVNHTDESLNVAVDGKDVAVVAVGAAWDGTVPYGTHVLSAVSQPTQRPYETTLTIAPAGAGGAAVATWEVTAGQASVIVENQTGEDLSVQVPGREPAPLARGKSLTIGDIPTGPLTVTAVGASSHLTYAGRVDLAPAQTAHWIAEPVTGSIRITNRTERRLWVYYQLRGGAETLAGQVVGDNPVIIRELPRTTIALTAVEPVGKRRYTTSIDLGDLPAASWTVTPATGSLAIDNRRDEPVTLYVDAVRVGDVPASTSRVFPGLGVGERVVEAVGMRTGYAQHDRATVTEDRVAAVTLPDPSAFVVVENATGETLATRGSLADQVAQLGPGSVTRFRVRAGVVRLATVGNDSGLTYQTDLEVKTGAPARWVVRQTPSTLVVWNRLSESVALTIDDRAVGSLAPEATVDVTDLAPGRRTVQAVGLKSGTLRTETLELSPGAVERLTFTLHLGILVVENRAAEPVDVTIDARPYGSVAAGAVHSFGNVPPGRHRVGFAFTRSHRESATDLDVREGQRALVVAEVPLALVVVENASRQPVRVTVDGETVGNVSADGPAVLMHVPAGARLVQFERMGDHTVVSFRLDFWADTAVHLPVPPGTARLVVVNRTSTARELRFGDRPIGTVAADSSTIFDDLPSAEGELSARELSGPDTGDGTGGSSRTTHSELRRFDPGETATWVLEPPPAARPE
ncbi:MAG: hypothetical protein U1F43_17445 [Myxococcota bacterium]